MELELSGLFEENAYSTILKDYDNVQKELEFGGSSINKDGLVYRITVPRSERGYVLRQYCKTQKG